MYSLKSKTLLDVSIWRASPKILKLPPEDWESKTFNWIENFGVCRSATPSLSVSVSASSRKTLSI